jgi:hypothetical protein
MDASFTAYALRQAVRAAAADDTSRIPAQHGQLVVMEGAVGLHVTLWADGMH